MVNICQYIPALGVGGRDRPGLVTHKGADPGAVDRPFHRSRDSDDLAIYILITGPIVRPEYGRAALAVAGDRRDGFVDIYSAYGNPVRGPFDRPRGVHLLSIDVPSAPAAIVAPYDYRPPGTIHDHMFIQLVVVGVSNGSRACPHLCAGGVQTLCIQVKFSACHLLPNNDGPAAAITYY